jgi:hypothetical protein
MPFGTLPLAAAGDAAQLRTFLRLRERRVPALRDWIRLAEINFEAGTLELLIRCASGIRHCGA